ncbi:MAG: carboxyl transferase domain-containing protein [Phycisphaerales bacterium]
MGETATPTLQSLTAEFLATEAKIREGGGPKAIERQHAKNRLTARERVAKLIDEGAFFQELALWAAHGMYAEHAGAPAAGVVTGIAPVQGRPHMIIANDATVKAGAFFPMTCKKIIRAQMIARAARLPLIYLVDSAGVFLPLQEDVFPDTDDFGRIFFLNAKISAEGIPQTAAIMGYCVAGGGYLPVLCDTLIMTEGSGLYLAGPALVKAAIGQDVTDEELGGASMHAAISGTIDFKEPDDDAAITRLRNLAGKYGLEATERQSDGRRSQITPTTSLRVVGPSPVGPVSNRPESPSVAPSPRRSVASSTPHRDPNDIYTLFTDKPGQQYDVKDILACIVDSRVDRTGGAGFQPARDAEAESSKPRIRESLAPDLDEYKPDYGASIVCAYARINSHPVAILANQGKLTEQSTPGGKSGPSKSTNMPRVIYQQAADKAARFIMDANQRKIPLIFFHDTTGFMVGRDSEQAGIIRAGAKMVNAMSNSVVPKIVVIMGGSYGAGNYAMCGRAFDQFLSLAWPGSKCAVMGAAQATGVLAMIEERSRERKGEQIDKDTHERILAAVRESYNEQQDIRHAASRGWIDRIIEPHRTREELTAALEATRGWDYACQFKTGVLQT